MLFSGDARFRVTVARVQFFERFRVKAKSFVLTVVEWRQKFCVGGLGWRQKFLCRRSRMEAKSFVSAESFLMWILCQ